MTLWIADAAPDYQPGLNVPSLAREGYSALIIKATEGRTWRSKPLANQWAKQARESGLIVGAYHWLTNSPVYAQLDNFLDRITEFGWPGNMLIALDVEDTRNSPTWDCVQQWVQGWYERTGGHPLIIYTGQWWWNAAGRRWNGGQLTPYLWHAQYVMQPGNKNLPMAGYGSDVYGHVPQSWWATGYGGWPRATMLQFTSRGTAAGVAANVDISAFEGTIGDLRALTGNAPQPASTRQENEEMVLIYALTAETSAAYGETPNMVWASNGVFRWHIPDPGQLSAIQELGNAGAYPIFKGGEIQWLGSHIGHDVSGDTRLVANSERILTCWAQGEKPYGIRYSEDGAQAELGNPFTALGEVIQQILTRPVAEITDDQIMAMATAIAEHMATSVEAVATVGQALMVKLNAALAGAATALTAAMQDPVPRPAAQPYAPRVGGQYPSQHADGPHPLRMSE